MTDVSVNPGVSTDAETNDSGENDVHRVLLRITLNPDGYYSAQAWHEHQHDYPILSAGDDVVQEWALEFPVELEDDE